MVEKRKAPFVANEQQQEALNKLKQSAHDWALAAAAQKEFTQENPGINKNELSSFINEQYQNPTAAQAEAQRKNIPQNIISQTYFGEMEATNDAIKKDNNAYSKERGAIKAALAEKIHVQVREPDPGVLAEQKEEREIKAARVLSDEEKQELIAKLKTYFTEVEIKARAVSRYMAENPNLPQSQKNQLYAFIPTGIEHPFIANNIDYPIQAKNGLLKITDQVIDTVKKDIDSNVEHKDRIDKWHAILPSVLSPVPQREISETKSSKILKPEEEEAIEKVRAFAKKYELRNAAVAAVMKENPDIAKTNSNKIMEYMAIPNPMDALDSRNPLAGELRKAYNEATISIKEEITKQQKAEKGEYFDTIKNMKEDLLKSFTPLQKSEMKGTDLPDHVKEETFKVALELRSQFKESGVNPNASTDVRVSKGITNKGGDLALA